MGYTLISVSTENLYLSSNFINFYHPRAPAIRFTKNPVQIWTFPGKDILFNADSHISGKMSWKILNLRSKQPFQVWHIVGKCKLLLFIIVTIVCVQRDFSITNLGYKGFGAQWCKGRHINNSGEHSAVVPYGSWQMWMELSPEFYYYS